MCSGVQFQISMPLVTASPSTMDLDQALWLCLDEQLDEEFESEDLSSTAAATAALIYAGAEGDCHAQAERRRAHRAY